MSHKDRLIEFINSRPMKVLSQQEIRGLKVGNSQNNYLQALMRLYDLIEVIIECSESIKHSSKNEIEQLLNESFVKDRFNEAMQIAKYINGIIEDIKREDSFEFPKKDVKTWDFVLKDLNLKIGELKHWYDYDFSNNENESFQEVKKLQSAFVFINDKIKEINKMISIQLSDIDQIDTIF